MVCVRLLAFSSALFSVAGSCNHIAEFYSILQHRVSNESLIFYPYNASSSPSLEVTKRWDIFTEPSFNGVIKAATEKDIQTAILLASKHGIPFLATAGGHGTSGTLGRLNGGLNIDIGRFNAVEFNPGDNTITVGGAAHFSQIINLLHDAGREMPVISSNCVGVVGATLNGGLGIMQGIHGPLLDSLLSVRLVTAKGNIVEASEKQNPDLFWGIRGAGFNFGIVISAKYKVFPATNGGQVTNADFLYVAPQNGSVWQLMSSFDKNLSAKMALTFFVLVDPSVPGRVPVIAVNAVYFGPEEEAALLLEPMRAIQPIMSNVTTVPANRVLDAQFFGQTAGNGQCDSGNVVNIYSLALNQTDVQAWTSHFNRLVDFYAEYPTYQGRLLVQRFPASGALALPDDATAFPHREAKIQVNMEGWYTNRSLDTPVSDFLRNERTRFQETSGFPELSVYAGYAHGDEGPAAWYSSRKLKRLVALKNRWDPKDLFSWNNPIPNH
ncbi:hypothetical protein TruAng_009590 [Truncatella angustata]|nr:hypothetical protein TruAng_009590 [Truncatella angustata]